MIAPGMKLVNIKLCPSCGREVRMIARAHTGMETVCCRNKKCRDKDVLYYVHPDRLEVMK